MVCNHAVEYLTVAHELFYGECEELVPKFEKAQDLIDSFKKVAEVTRIYKTLYYGTNFLSFCLVLRKPRGSTWRRGFRETVLVNSTFFVVSHDCPKIFQMSKMT